MFSRGRLTLAFIGFAINSAAAMELPDYDVDGFCRPPSWSNDDILRCIRSEQESYNALTAIWQRLDEPAQQKCKVEGDKCFNKLRYRDYRNCLPYHLVDFCAQEELRELEAKRELNATKFKR